MLTWQFKVYTEAWIPSGTQAPSLLLLCYAQHMASSLWPKLHTSYLFILASQKEKEKGENLGPPFENISWKTVNTNATYTPFVRI